MILYFTGTGNSRFIARQLGELLNDKVYDIAGDLRVGHTGRFLGEERLVFVTSTYMSRMPLDVEKYIRDSNFDNCGNTYFVFSSAQAVGKAANYCEKLCKEKNLSYHGISAVKSPANYVVMYDVLPKTQAKQEMEKSIPAIQTLAKQIRNGDTISADSAFNGHKPFSAFAPAVMKMATAKGFHVSDACISCGSCERTCPLGNVTLRDGKPAWGDKCTHCMGCISVCPKKAIDYGKKTATRNRYYLEG